MRVTAVATGQRITAHDSVHLALSWGQPYNKLQTQLHCWRITNSCRAIDKRSHYPILAFGLLVVRDRHLPIFSHVSKFISSFREVFLATSFVVCIHSSFIGGAKFFPVTYPLGFECLAPAPQLTYRDAHGLKSNATANFVHQRKATALKTRQQLVNRVSHDQNTFLKAILIAYCEREDVSGSVVRMLWSLNMQR